MPSQKVAQGALLSTLVASALANPVEIIPRANCPAVHVFGARETTAPPGYGSSSTVVNGILNAFPGSTSEAIVYPACGGQSSCGGASYGSSVAQGTTAVCNAIKTYAASCPSTQLVIVGYSQGGEIFDNALCGGGDPNQGLSSTCSIASYNIKAAIFMGDPRYEYGIPYGVGTCKAGGFDARPAGQSCGSYNSLIQSYCDSADPYCCNGNDANVHQGYGAEYGQQAIAFVKSKLSSSGGSSPTSTPPGTTKTTTTPGSSSPTGGSTAPEYGQCGGQGWTGPTTCPSGWTCKAANAYYSQCLK